MLGAVKKSLIFIISAPSGAGKTTLVKALVAAHPTLYKSISHTTRSPREAEINAQDYYFIDQDLFLEKKQQGVFLESAYIYGQYYGTSRIVVEEMLAAGKDVILEIDYQGFEQVKKIWPKRVCGIFVLPPSLFVLRERLEKRGRDSAKEIEDRLTLASHEVSKASMYDFIVVNQDFDKVLGELQKIIHCSYLFSERYF